MSRPDPKLLPLRAGLAPEALAAGLCHLPGFFFLDSSSAGEGTGGNGGMSRFSLITARPRSVIRGNLFDPCDFGRLGQLLAGNRFPEETTPDLGFPGAGLYGTIGYEGDFVFGEYHEFLVYDHRLETWRECGALSSEWIPQPEDPPLMFSAIEFQAGMDRATFCSLVDRARDYIGAGDIYQVNLSHRFTAARPADLDLFALYRRLREVSPVPFAAYTTLGGETVLSSSPEQFLRLSGRTIQTRPIKGTRPRFRDLERDEKSAYDLITSSKEIAELVMITDLERNDLGQVCEYGTVVATELLKLERYAQVFHLVSTVEGTLRAEIDHLSALRACFPGGSITGAPKKRAREIIAEFEPVPRGLYTGAIGCFGFNGESCFNIAIRTLVAGADRLHFHVGAGIVADSIPEKEWEETLHKAAGILRACE
jgi:anthranilate/para-aminobenzoate synthase component I